MTPDTNDFTKALDLLRKRDIKQVNADPVNRAHASLRNAVNDKWKKEIVMWGLGLIMGLNMVDVVNWFSMSPAKRSKVNHVVAVDGKPINGYIRIATQVALLIVVSWLWSRKSNLDKAYEDFTKAIDDRYPETAGLHDVYKLKRIMAVIPIIQSHLRPQERQEIEKVASTIVDTMPTQEQLDKIVDILAKHFADERYNADFQLFVDAVEGKAMPWDVANSQYTNYTKDKGARS